VASIDAERPLPRRLRKRAAESLELPLRAIDDCWHAGRLLLVTPEKREPHRAPLETLVFDDDQLFFDCVALELERGRPRAYALLNKPKHVTSSARDPRGKSDLAPYLRAMPAGCFAVGRLDRETTGLLLFTNDGDLASAISRPDHETPKSYWLWLDDALADDDPRLGRWVDGVMHHGERLAAKDARIVARTEHSTELELTLTQGRNRQIRHMCFALELHLVQLHRKRIGPLSDADLPLGSWRFLAPSEVDLLWQAVGGRAHVRWRKVTALVRQAGMARNAGAPNVRLERWLANERQGAVGP
jgi:pseudouridine synthase